MAIKKKTTVLGPKAKLMKKSVDQLKRQAKKLKIQGYSTKKKEQLVNSIMMAEARAKRKPGATRKKKAATKTTRKISSAILQPNKALVSALEKMSPSERLRVMKNFGLADQKKPAVKPKVKIRKPMMAQSYNGWSNYDTWLANLWYGEIFVDLIREEYGEEVTYDQEYDVAQSIQYYLDDLVTDELEGAVSRAGYVADVVSAAQREINYRELANSVIDSIGYNL